MVKKTMRKSELTKREIKEIIEFSSRVTETARKYYLILAFFIECDKCPYEKTCDIKFTKQPCWKVELTRDYCIWRDLKSGKLAITDKVPQWVKDNVREQFKRLFPRTPPKDIEKPDYVR